LVQYPHVQLFLDFSFNKRTGGLLSRKRTVVNEQLTNKSTAEYSAGDKLTGRRIIKVGRNRSTMTLAPHIKHVWATWGVVTAVSSASALDVWSVSCACGYQTPRGLFTSVTLAATAWIGFFLPHARSYLVRSALDVWVIFTTALLGKHLADVLWLSPHAPFGLW
jgi:hypothetical protein